MRAILSLTLAAACVAAPVAQQDVAQTPAIVTTRHQVTIGGTVLRYTARAGTIPIRDNETGDVHAHMFFVAYTLDRAPGAPARPLTFLWNGGPGSNSGLVHLLGFGPKRITAATGTMTRYSSSGTALVDNQETWLTLSDLVFVDPIGTGYSRPTKPEYGAEFYQNQGDAESVAEFIRVCRLRLDALESPVYLMGESFGVTRASLVAEALTRRRTKVAGVILLSGGFPLEGRGAGADAQRAEPADVDCRGARQQEARARSAARHDRRRDPRIDGVRRGRLRERARKDRRALAGRTRSRRRQAGAIHRTARLADRTRRRSV